MKRKAYVVIGTISLLLCAACLLVAFWPHDYTDPIQAMVELPAARPTQKAAAQTPGKAADAEAAEAVEVQPTPAPYVSPIDFEMLQAENPDIYAWIQIPDTDISYPLVQREGDDAYYLNHDSSGAWTDAGAIYTESSYNGKDFTDPVTVVYGHRMISGARFGRLQETFEEAESFEQHKEVLVYLPDRELRFEIFAAVPHNSNHIMKDYDFTLREDYEEFLSTVSAAEGNHREELSVSPDDNVLVLCTCLRWDSSRRFLVLAKLA